MSSTIRFPLRVGVPGVGPAETTEIITLINGAVSLVEGGANPYVSILPWKLIQRQTESPFPCVVIEVSSNTPGIVIGNGTFAQQIGLFGRIGTAGTDRFLIGILGVARGGVAPQIPIPTFAGADPVGFAQKVSDVACYDELSVGVVSGSIVLAEGVTVTVRARPIHKRDWVG